MKWLSSIMALLYLLCFHTAQAQPNVWIQKNATGSTNITGDPSTGRYGGICFVIGNKAYIGSGINPAFGNYKQDFWEYDPATNTWTRKADIPVKRQQAAYFTIGNKGYLVTGFDGSNEKKDCWEYDATTNTWLQKNDFPGVARRMAAGFSIGSKGYLATGSLATISQKDTWEYNPLTDQWTRKNDFGGDARMAAATFSIGNKGYLGLGFTTNLSIKKDFWEFDPVADNWSQKTDYPGGETFAASAFESNGKGYIGLGRAASTYKTDFWQYDPSLDFWSRKTEFAGTARSAAVGFSIGGKIYISSGIDINNTAQNDLWSIELANIPTGGLCTGSLGDPVVHISFDKGANNFQAPAGYSYVSNDCPNDGSYTIISQTHDCFSSGWHTLTSDHSGQGSFMLVNASYAPADFFVTTVNDLCPNTNYEFSAWIMNVLKSPGGIKPNLNFSIETPAGVILNSFSTGDIPVKATPQWEKYGFYFTTTAGNSSVVIRIRNNAPGGSGNDLALDDIMFRPCGPSVSANIINSAGPVNVCIDQQAEYDFTSMVSPGFQSPVFQWQVSVDSGHVWKDINAANVLTFTRTTTTAGYFWYRLTVSENGTAGISSCRIASNVLEINVHAKPFVYAGPDRIAVTGDSFQLNAVVKGEYPTYSWWPGDYLNSALLLNPVVKPANDMTYRLTATSSFGCVSEDFVSIKVVSGIFVPTAFTPNNDGKNDQWRIPYLDPAKGAEVSVFNRGGQLVYTVKAAEVNWDGKLNGELQPAGVYVYLIRFPNGQPVMKGIVTLIR